MFEDATTNPMSAHRLDCAAAICALPLPAYAFGPTATMVHRLPLPTGVLGDVQLVRHLGTDVRALHRRVSAKGPLPGVRVRSHDLSTEPLAIVEGIPTVSRELAAISTAAECDRDWAVAVLDAVAWESPPAIDRLAHLADEWPSLRGIGTVRWALPHVRCGAQTPLESLSRVRLMGLGLPEPVLQFPLYDRQGLIGYADMAWPTLGVIGEADGLLKYVSREALIQEKLREDRIRSLGFIVVRWTWDELFRDPAAIVARVNAASMLARRRAG